MAAFSLALEQGADGLELDVMLCGSGEVVVCHDADLSRLAGDDRFVRSLPWEELSGISLRDGGKIPLLSEVLVDLPIQASINVELKIFGNAEVIPLCRAVTRCLRKYAGKRQIVISSFHPGVLLWFRMAYPAIARGALFHKEQRWPGAYAPFVCADAMHPQAVLVTAESAALGRARFANSCLDRRRARGGQAVGAFGRDLDYHKCSWGAL